ncbi:uncharacterized protein LOC128642578 [Bombina bombina]|uniref:uncharacterized protein LOC128642578 n=1 Tax=Bombina bombina TaxID=8345 RepID=UPI00235AD854|nr:uncharacterized protein LOC128642578 [Bombina bombina]
MPVVSFCSLVPEYLLHQESKSDSKCVQSPPENSLGQTVKYRIFNIDCSSEPDKERYPVCRNVLPHVRDPLLKFRNRNQNCDVSRLLRNGDENFYRLSMKYPSVYSVEEKTPTIPRSRNTQQKDSQTGGSLECKLPVWPQHHPEVTRYHSFRTVPLKLVKSEKRSSMAGSVVGNLHKDVLALPGEIGNPFHLPLASNNMRVLQRLKLHQ